MFGAMWRDGGVDRLEHVLYTYVARPTVGEGTPLGRWGQPAELAPAYVYLASPESSFVIGETLHVNGGMPTP